MDNKGKVFVLGSDSLTKVSYAGGGTAKFCGEGFEIIHCHLGKTPIDGLLKEAWMEVYGMSHYRSAQTPEEVSSAVGDSWAKYVLTATYHEEYVAGTYGGTVNAIYYAICYCHDESPNCFFNILDTIDMKLRFIDLMAPELDWLGNWYVNLYSENYI